jgi:hypothetical protein
MSNTTMPTVLPNDNPKKKMAGRKGEKREKENSIAGVKRYSPLTPRTSPQRPPSPSWKASKVDNLSDKLSGRTQPVFTHLIISPPPPLSLIFNPLLCVCLQVSLFLRSGLPLRALPYKPLQKGTKVVVKCSCVVVSKWGEVSRGHDFILDHIKGK